MFKGMLLAGMISGLLSVSPGSDTCPCVDTFCIGFCDLLLRLVAARLSEGAGHDFETAEEPGPFLSDRDFLEQFLQQADQLRVHSQSPSGCPCPFGPASHVLKARDEPLSNEEMQEMLESAELLEADLENLHFGPDEPLDESVLGSEGAARVCPFQYQKRASARPLELTVPRAPRDLMLEEESELPTGQPAGGAGVRLKASRLLYQTLVRHVGYLPLSALSFVGFGHTPVNSLRGLSTP
jgi:hypothetical protein